VPHDPSLRGVPAAVRSDQAGLTVSEAGEVGGSNIAVVGVVGAGTMGAGIAQVALEAGHEVLLHDVDEEAIERGRTRIRDGLTRRAAKLDLDADSIDDWVGGRLANLRDGHTLDAVGAEAEIVIEAALEDLALKQAIFRALDAATGPDVILATNTSALSVTSIAQATSRPERVLGLHFFNPAPVMALVEVVSAPSTAASVVERAGALMARWGKTAVRCADHPGFIVNRVNRPFTVEALRLLEAGLASVEAIDSAVRAVGFPLGPFELIDLAGVDINHATTTGIWEGLGRPDRLRPSPLLERLIDAGQLGRKAGRGFYAYDGNGRGPVDPAFAGGPTSLGATEIRDRILAAIELEARLAVDERVATAEEIDLALRLGAGHPSGPFERSAAPTIER
jgi:3-hydroxybutyryl-CoA dehydrogenase